MASSPNPTTPPPDAARLSEPWRELAALMSELSEEHYAAGWMEGTEYHLWDAVVNGRAAWGMGIVEQSDLDELKRLSDKLGGWVYFDLDENYEGEGETFVTLAEWQPMFEKEMARWAALGYTPTRITGGTNAAAE